MSGATDAVNANAPAAANGSLEVPVPAVALA